MGEAVSTCNLKQKKTKLRKINLFFVKELTFLKNICLFIYLAALDLRCGTPAL